MPLVREHLYTVPIAIVDEAKFNIMHTLYLILPKTYNVHMQEVVQAVEQLHREFLTEDKQVHVLLLIVDGYPPIYLSIFSPYSLTVLRSQKLLQLCSHVSEITLKVKQHTYWMQLKDCFPTFSHQFQPSLMTPETVPGF